MTQLPTDADNNPIQALSLRDEDAHQIAFTTTSKKIGKNFNADTKVISIHATQDCFVKIGDQDVIASSACHFIPRGVTLPLAIRGNKGGTHKRIAAISNGTNGTLYISEMD